MRFKEHYLLSEFISVYLNNGQFAQDIAESSEYREVSDHPFSNHPLVRFLEAAKTKQSGISGGQMRQYASPEEDAMLWQKHADELGKRGREAKPTDPEPFKNKAKDGAYNSWPVIAHGMKQVTKAFEPFVLAFSDLVGQRNVSPAEISDDDVIQWLSQNGYKQIPELPSIKKALGVSKLRSIAEKANNGYSLEPQESQIYNAWKSLSKSNGGRRITSIPPMILDKVRASRDKLDPERLTGQEKALWQNFVSKFDQSGLHDPHSRNVAVMNYLKQGDQEKGLPAELDSPEAAYDKLSQQMEIITDQEALSKAIDKARFEFTQKASISGGSDSDARNAAVRFTGDEFKAGQMGITNPRNVPGAKQYITGKTAQTEKLGKNDYRPTGKEDDIDVPSPPNWYFAGNAGHGADKDVNKIYEKDRQAYESEILRAACKGVITAVAVELKKQNVRLSNITQARIDGPVDKWSCGFDITNPAVKNDWDTIDSFLEGHGLSVFELVEDVSKLLLNATAAPDFRTNEDRRNGLATLYARRLLMTKMHQKKVRSSNIAPTGDEGPKGDYSDMGSGTFSNEKGTSTGKERDELMKKIKSNKDKDFEDIISQIPNSDDADLLRQITDIVKRGRPADDDEADTVSMITDLEDQYPEIIAQWRDRLGY